MREIKFRVWDKTENKMARNVNEMLFNSKGLYRVVLNHMGFEFGRRVKEVVLEQYTGLKDKNGKEIYEGDIVRTALGYTQKVIWSDMYAAFVAVYKDKDRLNRSSMPYRVDCTDEIIGNIHENPELLEV